MPKWWCVVLIGSCEIAQQFSPEMRAASGKTPLFILVEQKIRLLGFSSFGQATRFNLQHLQVIEVHIFLAGLKLKLLSLSCSITVQCRSKFIFKVQSFLNVIDDKKKFYLNFRNTYLHLCVNDNEKNKQLYGIWMTSCRHCNLLANN